MKEFLIGLSESVLGNRVFQICALFVVFDTVFGCMRAIKDKKINSSFGIDGAIRKAAMLFSLVFLAIFDSAVYIDLMGFVPAEISKIANLGKVGTAEFFGLLYIAYELVSVLKNLTLCGLPLKKVWESVHGFLEKYTDELPDKEEKWAE